MRSKKLSAAQGALVFECQVQIAAAQALIDKTLREAGYSGEGPRARILRNNWISRGRVDVLEKLLPANPTPGMVPGVLRVYRRDEARVG